MRAAKRYGSCCRQVTSVAWMTSRACSRKPIAKFMKNGIEA
nr:MAG TPA: hypothetical protein [Caudoviricetes sp.]